VRNNVQSDLDQVQPGKTAVLGQLSDAAQGKGPSIAEAQLKQAQERSLSQQLAAAQANRGGSTSAGARRLAQNLASSGQQLGAQSAVAKLQEQQQAQQNFLGQANQQQQDYLDLVRQQLETDTAAQRTMQDYERAKSGAAATQSSLMSANQNASSGRLTGS